MGKREADAEPAELVPLDRIVRLRSAMPDESPIDLDEHAAMIAYDVQRQTRESIKRRAAHIEVTREYLDDVRRFLQEKRAVLQS